VKSSKNPSRNEAAAPAVLLPVRIQPRASKNEIVEMEGGGLKIRLTAPPVDGAANEALVRFLADRLGIAKSRVEIVSGHTGREKVIGISGMTDGEAKRLLIGGKE
jgi:uncharacterized protein (TIGR00251 family)